MKRGVKLNYKKEYDSMLINFLCKGNTFMQFTNEIGFSRACIWKWHRTIPSFKRAKIIGEQIRGKLK